MTTTPQPTPMKTDASSSSSPTSCQTYQNQCFGNGDRWYLNSEAADVFFTFQPNGKRIPAHKTILAVNSRVFEAMLFGDLKEPGDVRMTDSTEAIFVEFLQYFYLKKVKLTPENVVGVWYLGDKYDIQKCVDDCVHFFIHTLSTENVCTHLQLGMLHEQNDLIEACAKHIMLNTVAVFSSVGFAKCSKKVLGHILKMDVLSCSEVEVFEACMTWVKAKIGRADLSMKLVKMHLGDLYYDIRFASMTMQQLCTLQTKYGSLLSRDFVAITKMIAEPGFQPSKFEKSLRHANWNADAVIECDRVDEDSYSYDNLHDITTNEKTTFSANKPLILGSLACGEIYDGDPDDRSQCDLSTEMEITEATSLPGANSKVMVTMKIELDGDGTDISLPQPILIRPGFFYTIRMGPFPRHHMHESADLKRMIKLESDIEIQFHRDYTTALISKLDFNKI